MVYRKGTIVSVRQYVGCVEVIVDGERPGSFAIDNGCVWSIVDAEGPDWMGRHVEYMEGRMRFLDSREEEEADSDHVIPFPASAGSQHHI